ncbi:hypothetical protein CLV32_3587 [Pedobacter duraquae]|uniref:Uncharacterized protein n=2 Tax=Pedobacter duraquae TaxID=425511 RepID=A0A4R6IF49_9SPHI|nr:hypothetical protein CLV32_3587 [Pedobacter duraquae]
MGKMIGLLIIVLLLGCVSDEYGCLSDVEYDYHQHYNLILKKKKLSGRLVSLWGVNPENNEESNYESQNGYMQNAYDYLEVGDTIVKDSAAYFLLVRKPNKSYIFTFGCNTPKTIDSILYIK